MRRTKIFVREVALVSKNLASKSIPIEQNSTFLKTCALEQYFVSVTYI